MCATRRYVLLSSSYPLRLIESSVAGVLADISHKFQAIRDLYLVQKTVELEQYDYRQRQTDQGDVEMVGPAAGPTPARATSCVQGVKLFFVRYVELFRLRRLRTAAIASSTVALAQQLCGSTFSPPPFSVATTLLTWSQSTS
jgi:hypothetical protein